MPRSKSRLVIIAAFVLLLFGAHSAEAQKAKRPLTRAERVEVFEDVWQTIYERYYDPRFNGVDWAAQRAHYRPIVERAQSDEEFYRELKTMVASLHDSHTRVFTPEEKSDWERPKFISVGLSVRKIEGRPVVVDVRRGSPAETQGVRPGFVVTTVDGQPVDEVIARLRPVYGTSSTERSGELRVYSRIFHGPKGTTVRAEFLDAQGQGVAVTLTRVEETAAPELLYRRLPGDYGYISFNGFWPETAAEFERAMKALHNTRGLVIDLRENGGGAAFSAAQIASFLFPKQTSLGRFTSRSGRVIEPKTEPLEKRLYGGQVVVLISERSGSGAEVFAATLQEQGRVGVVGHPSCGCVLGINRRHVLPDGGVLDVSEVDYRTARGTRLEGVGVWPDTRTELRIADLLSGRDVALEMALTKLRETAQTATHAEPQAAQQ